MRPRTGLDAVELKQIYSKLSTSTLKIRYKWTMKLRSHKP